MIISKSTIEAMQAFEDVRKAEKTAKEARDELNGKIIDKLCYLREIGFNVLRKLTDYKFDKTELTNDSLIGWFLRWTELDFDSISMSTTAIYFDLKVRQTNNKKNKETERISIDISLLQYSDRDFAKMVRLKINKIKAASKVKESKEALRNLKKKQNELFALQREVRFLESQNFDEALKTANEQVDQASENIRERKRTMNERAN